VFSLSPRTGTGEKADGYVGKPQEFCFEKGITPMSVKLPAPRPLPKGAKPKGLPPKGKKPLGPAPKGAGKGVPPKPQPHK